MAKTLQITDLDFDKIKSNIIQYIKSDPAFKDYNFEASGLNTIVNILASNTHYLSYYLNMVTNEIFLDTAKTRNSVVSFVKMLNYIPDSVKSSTAVLSLNLRGTTNHATNDVVDTQKITSGVIFSSTLNNVEYQFIPKSTRVVEKSGYVQNTDGTFNNLYTINDLVVVQGINISEEYIVDRTDINQRFIISNAGVDTNSIRVYVKDSINATTFKEYKKSNDNMRLSSISDVYFLQEGYDGKYEIFFGDGVLGSLVDSGNVVTISYNISAGSVANGISTFVLSSNSEQDKFTITDITTENPSFGGADLESIESIKFYAPRIFEGQNRAVTVRDYKAIIPKVYPETASSNVWGGEDNIPPQYGRVYIAIRPTTGYYLTDYEKSVVKEALRKEYSVVTIIPEIVDPEYTRIVIDTKIKYDENRTTLDPDEIKTLIQDFIVNYGKTNLNEFDSYFRYSNFIRNIDDVHSSITNNETKIQLINESIISFNAIRKYTFNFNNPIKKGTISSSGIVVNGSTSIWYMEETETFDGKLRFYTLNTNNAKEYAKGITGSVDYSTGQIIIDDIIITSAPNDMENIAVQAETSTLDVFPRRNQILLMQLSDLTVSVEPDNEDFNNNYNISTQNVTIIK